MPSKQDLQLLISEYIKKQMVILGPSVAITKARKVDQLKVNGDGTVKSMGGDAQQALNKLVGEYEALEGELANTALLSLQEEYFPKEETGGQK